MLYKCKVNQITASKNVKKSIYFIFNKIFEI
jgi:hypothetical protein